MTTNLKSPAVAELKAILGHSEDLWFGVIRAVEEMFTPIDKVWKPSKEGFGWFCLLQHKKRTLLYLIPDKEGFLIAIVLGERAYNLAMASSLPASIKRMLSEARPYAEGRGIRFPINSTDEIPIIKKLVGIKTTPK